VNRPNRLRAWLADPELYIADINNIEVVSKMLEVTSIKTTEKHYAPWVAVRQRSLEEAVKGTW